SLTRRYVLYLAGVIAVLLFGSLIIISTVVRSGFTELFSQRMSMCRDVLEQYSQAQKLITLRKLEAVLTSPRFLAAIATADSGTIHRESPTYRGILEADFMLIADDNYNLVYSSKHLDSAILEEVGSLSAKKNEGLYVDYLIIGNEVFEVLCSDIVTNDGVFLGQLIAGMKFSAAVSSQLRDLTGFDVLFSREGEVFGHSNSRLTKMVAEDNGFYRENELVLNAITKKNLFGEEVLYLALSSSYANATITFIGSLDDYLAPIMKKIKLFLITLTSLGGFGALLAVYAVTKRRIGRQVDALVNAAERIAAGDTKFIIKPLSNDELGYLASEFEQMRSKLTANRSELEKAHEERITSERLATTGKFAAGIIHDLKNPLAVIKASTELLQMKNGEDPKVVKHCFNINKQIDRMVDLTRDILEYCRGNTRLELRPVNLGEYFNEVVDFHGSSYKKAGIILELTGDQSLTVNLDPNRFRRVIDNLLNNAREALKPGDKVSIKWGKNQDKLEILISDTGPGIPENIKPSLFEPFVTSGKESGTGLGLAVAKKIIEDHGATISFKSETGVGTSFKIELPIELVELAKSETVLVS
ncbi:MAG TPA: HAMP domain-containing sensor histidine kinase, partial [candidate division Zixibacteria bacterium]|nr:HAMP domain-containing sensor histidine kinase [candidate division Zixibacteria bacterium]